MTKIALVLVCLASGCAANVEVTESSPQSLCTIEDQEAGLCGGPVTIPPVYDWTGSQPSWSLPTTEVVQAADLPAATMQEVYDRIGETQWGWLSSAGFASAAEEPAGSCAGDGEYIGCSFHQNPDYSEFRRSWDFTCWINGPFYSAYCTGVAVVDFVLVGTDLFVSRVHAVYGRCGRGTLRC